MINTFVGSSGFWNAHTDGYPEDVLGVVVVAVEPLHSLQLYLRDSALLAFSQMVEQMWQQFKHQMTLSTFQYVFLFFLN